MLNRIAAVLLVCASTAMWVSCGSSSSKYLYVAVPTSNEILAYREDPGSGVLTELVGSPISAGQSVQSIVIDPAGKYLYAANEGESDVAVYSISSSGALTEADSTTGRMPTGTAPNLLAMDSGGKFLYVANSGSYNISVYSIGAAGALTQVAGSPFGIGIVAENMKVSPSGGTLYITGAYSQTQGVIEAFTLTQGVPCVTSQSCFPPNAPYYTGTNPAGLAISASGGFLYTANDLDESISEFTVNPDGSLTAFSSTVGESYFGPTSLFINKSGTYLYVANQTSANLGAYGVNSDGSLTLLTISPFATAKSPSVVTGDSTGNYLFVGNQAGSTSAVESFNLDGSTGALSEVASYTIPGNVTSIAITP